MTTITPHCWIGRALSALAATLAMGSAAQAADVRVAVAANFTEPAKDIAARFERATGDHVVLSFGASGQLYTQIANAAPFDVLLSADADRPLQAEKAGLGVKGSRFTYATGRLVLWSPGAKPGENLLKDLQQDRFDKVSIADPAAAPYGLAAVQTLQHLHLYEHVKARIVQGGNITQAFQFVQTGAAPAGFVALSQVIGQTGGVRWTVPESDHAPITQQAVLLTTAANNPAARAFLAYLKRPDTRAVIRRYGYDAR